MTRVKFQRILKLETLISETTYLSLKIPKMLLNQFLTYLQIFNINFRCEYIHNITQILRGTLMDC